MPAELILNVARILRPVPLIQSYQLTETGPIATMGPAEHFAALRHPEAIALRRLQSAGKPAWSSEISIRDPLGNECPRGETGEISVKTPGNMSGYYRDEAASASVLRDGFVMTGDVGYMDKQGYLYITGRAKDMIVLGIGYNVFPNEIEDVLCANDRIVRAAVIGVPDKDGVGELVVACVVKKDEELTTRDVIGSCRGKLADYKVPRHVVFMDALPTNASGKVIKRALALQWKDALKC